MGKRSTTSTKSGKFMNPTDQARKEQRRKELKKNKKQRMAVRHAVLKGKDTQKLLTDLDELDDMELNPLRAPSLGEKVLKDKRKKLLETFDRVMKLYEREEPEVYTEFKELYEQYNERRARKQQYYDEVKSAERVLIDDIPLPDQPVSAPVSTSDIPLPQPRSILKKSATISHQDEHRRKPPGPPPGPPPALSDSENEEEMDTSVAKPRSIRFQDETTKTVAAASQEDEEDKESESTAKPITPLQAAMLKMAAEKAAKSLEESQDEPSTSANEDEEEVFAEHGNITDVLEDIQPPAAVATTNQPPVELPPVAGLPSQLPEPIIYRGPGGAPVIGLHPASLRPPAGLLPPGPPPGLPPALRLHRLPTGLPPRLIRPPMSIPPPGMRPGMQQSNVLSAPPSIMKPPTSQSSKDTHATISAKPIIKHHIGDVTRFMPTSLKIKRDGQKKPTPISKSGVSSMQASASSSHTRKAPAASGQTKDDAYDMFMKEMEGIM